MAQIITVEQKAQPKTGSVQKQTPKTPLFRTINYVLMSICILLLILGYYLLAGGKSLDPEGFSEQIFNKQRIVIAPILMLSGIILGVIAIMYHPKNKTQS